MENAPPSTDIRSFYAELYQAFENLFGQQHCKDDIAEIIEALENTRPIADLIQSPNGSFSTIFLPFHSGAEKIRNAIKIGKIHPKLTQFCFLCGKIEGLTDTMGISGEEPSTEDKEKLLPLLREFLSVLPSVREFKTWTE